MIAGLSKRIASFFVRNEVIKSEDEDVYEYGLQLLLSTVFKVIAMKKIYISCLLLFLLFSFASCGIPHESDAFISSSESTSFATKHDNENTSVYQTSSYKLSW